MRRISRSMKHEAREYRHTAKAAFPQTRSENHHCKQRLGSVYLYEPNIIFVNRRLLLYQLIRCRSSSLHLVISYAHDAASVRGTMRRFYARLVINVRSRMPAGATQPWRLSPSHGERKISHHEGAIRHTMLIA